MMLVSIWSFGTIVFLVSGFFRPAYGETDGNCNLLPSELGPDWYKVARPVPTEFADMPDYERSYVHMPCAVTTVFDVAICGCTNLMSFLFSSVKNIAKKTVEMDETPPANVVPDTKDDLIKYRDPADFRPDTSVGSRIINTRTGEVTSCPFRTSSRGKEWYLMREPTDAWRPMKCSPGTLFEKRFCTCVHKAVASRSPHKPEDDDLVVLEEEYEENDDTKGEDKISKSLGISVSDVDFRPKADADVPFWRRNKHINHISKPSKDSAQENVVVPDVIVTLNDDADENVGTSGFGLNVLGRDTVSTEHRRLLKRLREGPSPFVRHTQPLFIDSSKNKQGGGRHIDSIFKKDVKLDFEPNLEVVPDAETLNIELSDASIDSVVGSGGIKNALAVEFIGSEPEIDGAKVLTEKERKISIIEEGILNLLNDKERKDEVYQIKPECPKRPVPELGPQFFLLIVWGAGYIPYMCHGNRIYDDTVCACVPAPAESTIDEENLPKPPACRKTALPELGPRYFQMHLWGAGHVPYACHDNNVFSQKLCACVSKKGSDQEDDER